jgi:hypothetical protein
VNEDGATKEDGGHHRRTDDSVPQEAVDGNREIAHEEEHHQCSVESETSRQPVALAHTQECDDPQNGSDSGDTGTHDSGTGQDDNAA